MTALLERPLEQPRMTGPTHWPESWGPAPRWATPRNPKLFSYGPELARWCKKLTGFDPYPHQRYTWDVSLEVRADGHGWEHPEVLKTIPRQSGKSFEQAPITAHRSQMHRDSQIFITAQTGDKAVSRWLAASKVIERTMTTAKKLVSTAHERTIWQNGSIFRPFAPTEGALDGETPDLVFVDELWAFDTLQQELMENSFAPAVFMNVWGQLIKMSTSGTQRSHWFNSDRERGRQVVEEGRPSSFAFFDWGIPEHVNDVPAMDLPDDVLVRLVLDHHPLKGRHPRITFNELMDELGRGRAKFVRGLGNLTVEERGKGFVDDSVWERASSRAMIPVSERIGIGVDVDDLGREAVIYAGWRDSSGLGVVEIIERGSGQGWAAQRVRDLRAKWDIGAVAVNYAGPARSVGDAIVALGIEIVKVYGPDLGAATARFLDDLSMSRQTHDELRDGAIGEAMRAGELKRRSTGPTIERKGADPVTAVRAAVMAMWAADHMTEPEPEQAPFRIY